MWDAAVGHATKILFGMLFHSANPFQEDLISTHQVFGQLANVIQAHVRNTFCYLGVGGWLAYCRSDALK